MSKQTETIILNANSVDLGSFRVKERALTEGVQDRSASVWKQGGIQTGVWESTTGSFVGTREGYAEICFIMEGKATIRVEGSEDRELNAGDIFITPSGWVGTWIVHEPIKKHYIIVSDQ